MFNEQIPQQDDLVRVHFDGDFMRKKYFAGIGIRTHDLSSPIDHFAPIGSQQRSRKPPL